MLKNIKNFGVAKAVREKVEIANQILASGNNPKQTVADLSVILEAQGCFDPVKNARLIALYKADKTSEAYKALEAEREAVKPKFTEVIGKPFAEALQETIGTENMVSIVKKQKINYKGELMDVQGDLPMGLDFFKNPLNPKYACTSVFGAQLNTEEIEETGEKVVRVMFLSLCYDQYDRKYNIHTWFITYGIKAKTVTVEETTKAEEEIATAFMDW